MDISFRSCLIAGVATITAAAVALAPSVKEPTPAAAHPQAVQIASPPTNLPGLLIQWLPLRAVAVTGHFVNLRLRQLGIEHFGIGRPTGHTTHRLVGTTVAGMRGAVVSECETRG